MELFQNQSFQQFFVTRQAWGAICGLVTKADLPAMITFQRLHTIYVNWSFFLSSTLKQEYFVFYGIIQFLSSMITSCWSFQVKIYAFYFLSCNVRVQLFLRCHCKRLFLTYFLVLAPLFKCSADLAWAISSFLSHREPITRHQHLCPSPPVSTEMYVITIN